MITFLLLSLRTTQLLTALVFGTTYVFAAGSSSTNYDDQSSFFIWKSKWHTVSTSNPCPSCFFQPDPTQLYDQTWHDGSFGNYSSGVVKFTGSEIYIYGADTYGGGAVTFSLDGGTSSTHNSTVTSGWEYNVVFFSATELDPSTAHIIDFQVSDYSAVIDYAVVVVDTTETQTSFLTSAGAQTSNSFTPLSTSSTNQTTEASVSAQSNKPNHTTVIGIVISVVIATILLTIAGIVILRRKQQQTKASGATIAIQPFVDDQRAVTTSSLANSEHGPFYANHVNPPELSVPLASTIPPSHNTGHSDENQTDRSMAQRVRDIEYQLAEIRRVAGRDLSSVISDGELPPSYYHQ